MIAPGHVAKFNDLVEDCDLADYEVTFGVSREISQGDFRLRAGIHESGVSDVGSKSVRLAAKGTNPDMGVKFFRSDFSAFWLGETNCTEI